jgi:hypothetical protein
LYHSYLRYTYTRKLPRLVGISLKGRDSGFEFSLYNHCYLDEIYPEADSYMERVLTLWSLLCEVSPCHCMLKQTAFSDKVSLVAIFFPFRKETDTGNL